MYISKCEACMEECPQAQGRHEAAVGRMYAMRELAKCAPYWDSLFDENEEPKITPARLRELVQADRDGRCYIANVKIGEQVFVPDKKGKVIACRVQGISLPAHGKNLIIHLGGYPAEYLWSDREGKDWWKTRESAEAALKGEQDG